MNDVLTPKTMERLQHAVACHPYPLVFATISGAHLYGFPSPDSDYDLRGCHILPVREVVGLNAGNEKIETSEKGNDFELDLDSDLKFHRSEYERLRNVLEASHLVSGLPEVPTARGDLSDLLMQLRLRRSDRYLDCIRHDLSPTCPVIQ